MNNFGYLAEYGLQITAVEQLINHLKCINTKKRKNMKYKNYSFFNTKHCGHLQQG